MSYLFLLLSILLPAINSQAPHFDQHSPYLSISYCPGVSLITLYDKIPGYSVIPFFGTGVVCHKCNQREDFNSATEYPKIISTSTSSTCKSSMIELVRTSMRVCALTIDFLAIDSDKPPSLTLSFESIPKQLCNNLNKQILVCEDTNCKSATICCSVNKCNYPKYFKIKRLIRYFNETNNALNSSYTQHTSKRCMLDYNVKKDTYCALVEYTGESFYYNPMPTTKPTRKPTTKNTVKYIPITNYTMFNDSKTILVFADDNKSAIIIVSAVTGSIIVIAVLVVVAYKKCYKKHIGEQSTTPSCNDTIQTSSV